MDKNKRITLFAVGGAMVFVVAGIAFNTWLLRQPVRAKARRVSSGRQQVVRF
jgi:hypothetical protein